MRFLGKNIKRVIDLSQPFYDGCPHCPANGMPVLENILTVRKDGANLERIITSLHTGTHVDAPRHLYDELKSIDEYPLESFMGQAVPLKLTNKGCKEPIEARDLEKYGNKIGRDDIVLLVTGWGLKRSMTEEWIHNSPYLTEEGALYLAEKQIKGVGIDHFTVGTTIRDIDFATHTALFKAGIWIVEDMFLPEELFSREKWFFIAMPMNIKGVSGSFVRPVVFDVM